MDLSFQLYSAREHGPWDAVFARLAELGYAAVEGYAALYADPAFDGPAALADALAAHALAMPSGHVAVDALEDDAASAFATARALGIETIYAPFLAPEERPRDADGWHAFGRRLRAVGERVRGEGFGFGWHNHDFELVPLADGAVPLELLFEAAPDIEWEADLAWLVRAGADPGDWIARHGERATAVHLKDLAPAGEAADEDGWADVGHGTMDWPTLVDALRAQPTPRRWIVEHDAPSDLDRFARRAMASWRRWTGAEIGTGARP